MHVFRNYIYCIYERENMNKWEGLEGEKGNGKKCTRVKKYVKIHFKKLGAGG